MCFFSVSFIHFVFVNAHCQDFLHYLINLNNLFMQLIECQWRDKSRSHTGLRIIRPTRQVTRATHVRNRVFPRVELILKIIIILLIIFLGYIKSKPC